MVSRSAWPCGRADCSWLWGRISAYHYSDSRDDPVERLRSHLLVVRYRPRACRRRALPAAEGAAGRRGAAIDPTGPIGSGLRPFRGVALADLLGFVRDVRAGGCGRPDGNRTAGTDRQRLPDRQDPGLAARSDAAGAHFRAVDRPRT